MIVRPAAYRDLEAIYQIHKQHDSEFGLPVNEAVAQLVAEDKGRIVGYGMLRPIIEQILVLDLSLSLRDRITALKELVLGSLVKSRSINADQVHAFVQDPDFSRLLQKHFGYRPCKGEALYQETSNG